LFYPNWQEAAKQLASAPPPAAEPKVETPAVAFAKTEPLPKAVKQAAKKAPAEKKPVAKKSSEKAAATSPKEKKPAAKKPVAKTTESKPKKK
jgi:hypothetical protein